METFISLIFPEVREKEWFRKLHRETGRADWVGPSHHLTWKKEGSSIYINFDHGLYFEDFELHSGDIFELRDLHPESLRWAAKNPNFPRHVRLICQECFNSDSLTDERFREWVRYYFCGL